MSVKYVHVKYEMEGGKKLRFTARTSTVVVKMPRPNVSRSLDDITYAIKHCSCQCRVEGYTTYFMSKSATR